MRWERAEVCSGPLGPRPRRPGSSPRGRWPGPPRPARTEAAAGAGSALRSVRPQGPRAAWLTRGPPAGTFLHREGQVLRGSANPRGGGGRREKKHLPWQDPPFAPSGQHGSFHRVGRGPALAGSPELCPGGAAPGSGWVVQESCPPLFQVRIQSGRPPALPPFLWASGLEAVAQPGGSLLGVMEGSGGGGHCLVPFAPDGNEKTELVPQVCSSFVWDFPSRVPWLQQRG